MTTQLNTVEAFNKKLASFQKAITTSQNAARMCSNFAILHFEKCGDLGPAQRFYNVLRKETNAKFLKRDGYLVWLTTHAPIVLGQTNKAGEVIDKHTFFKDKSNEAVKFNTAVAVKIPYWMFSRDIDEQLAFTEDDIWKAIKSISTKFSAERYVGNDNGQMALNQVDNLLKKNAPELMMKVA
jgi:hypothetical protein